MHFLKAHIFPEETLLHRLSGLSGSSVYLIRSPSNALFIRKMSNSPEGSFRLEQQFNKLSVFQKYSFTAINSPKILNIGDHDDCFYMDLEYVQGVDMIDYLASADISQLRHFGERLGSFLIEMGQQPSIEKVPENVTQVFYEKIFTLVEKCPWLSDKLKVDLFLGVKKIAHFLESKASLCHGDFTFENILIDKNNEICLIDHTDSFYSYYWQDISKLHQDLCGEWFRFRRPSANIPKYALSYLSNCILKYVCKFDPCYLSVHNELLALVFSRILPYTTDNEVRKFVISRLSHYLECDRDNECIAC